MEGMVKKYVPYALVILAIYMLVPLIFLSESLNSFSAIAYYFIFPATAIACSAFFCAKYGMDFFFSLIAPIIYLPSMLIYNNGFEPTNLILLVSYLVAGIFGLFIGDIALGDKRRQKEQQEQAEAEEMMLEAKRRDDEFKENLNTQPRKSAARPVAQVKKPSTEKTDDDFDYSKYVSDIDKTPVKSTEDEINDILGEFGSSGGRDY